MKAVRFHTGFGLHHGLAGVSQAPNHHVQEDQLSRMLKGLKTFKGFHTSQNEPHSQGKLLQIQTRWALSSGYKRDRI